MNIHFINRVDDDNIGDKICSPYIYYYDFFKNFNCIRHDIDYINWIEISRYDVVIIGGGGMLYVTEDFQKNINRLLDVCPTVIAWSIGFNTHSDRPINTCVDTSRFKLIGIRDFEHPSGLQYLPCVSCLSVELEKVKETKRKIGIIEHKYFPVSDNIKGDRINNGENFQTITDFIASSEIIISSSYHNIFWAILMGKKTICANPFSTKFDYFKYKPVLYTGNLEEDISKTKIYSHALSESRELNIMFFNNVKNIIESLEEKGNTNYQHIYQTTAAALLRRRNGDMRHEINFIRKENELLHRQLDEIHNLINEANNRISETNNRIDEIQNQLSNEINNLQREINKKTSLRYFARQVKKYFRKKLFGR